MLNDTESPNTFIDGLYVHLGQSNEEGLVLAQHIFRGEEYDSDAIMDDVTMDSSASNSNISNWTNDIILDLIKDYIQDFKCMNLLCYPC